VRLRDVHIDNPQSGIPLSVVKNKEYDTCTFEWEHKLDLGLIWKWTVAFFKRVFAHIADVENESQEGQVECQIRVHNFRDNYFQSDHTDEHDDHKLEEHVHEIEFSVKLLTVL
jgi:hypothetical protein